MTVLPQAGSGRPVPLPALPGSGRAAGDGDGTGVGDDVPVEHLDAPARPGGDRVVVGDEDDRRPLLVEFFQQGQDCGAGSRVEVAGRLVGQGRDGSFGHARAIATRCRSPTESRLGRWACRCDNPTSSRSRPARFARSFRGRVPDRGICTFLDRRGRGMRWNDWNTNPIRDARSAASSRSRIRATSIPVMRTVPAVGLSRVPIRCSSVDLPDPDGPATATSSPAATARLA